MFFAKIDETVSTPTQEILCLQSIEYGEEPLLSTVIWLNSDCCSGSLGDNNWEKENKVGLFCWSTIYIESPTTLT